jgi:hypothetical protein
MTSLAAPLRRATMLLVALAVAAACLVALVPHPATGDPGASAPRRWSGYAIPATGHAAGGWIGGYRVDGTTLFLTTPGRRPNRAGYESPGQVGDLPGRAASQAETARAAWILSKYGAYRDATQAAAVDASVYHLLVGGAWRITKAHGARRIRQSGNGAAVARFARIMLRQSRASAGRYTAELVASTADVGGAVAITLSVTDGHGRPASGLPVTLSMAGASSAPTVTGDDGRAVARFAADVRGWQDVTATIGQVPEHRLHTWTAERDKQASAAEGGARRTLVVTGRTAVRGPQTLALKASPEALTVGGQASVVATVAGDGVSRAASASMYGPFASSGAAQCTGPAIAAPTAEVTTDGAYTMPSVAPGAGGYYAWRVAVDGTDTSLPVASCGAVVKVRSRTSAAITAPSVAPVGNVQVTVSVAGVPFPTKVDLVVKLYNAPGCTSAISQHPLSRLGNGQVTSGPIWLDAGSYTWKVEALPGELWEGSESSCGASGSTTQVQ